MTHEEQPERQGSEETNSPEVVVKRPGKTSPKGDRKSTATIDELLGAIREGFVHIGEAIGKLENIEFYNADENRKDAIDELEHYSSDLYFRIIGAFEILQLSESMKEIRHRWDDCVKKGLSDYSIEIHDGDPYIDCATVTVLRAAASILELAVLRGRIQERREERREAEQRESERAQREEQHAHERITREEQHAHERRTLRISSSVGIITVLLSLAFGNCDKIAAVFEGSEPTTRTSLVFSGAVSTLDNSNPPPVRVVCEPAVEGVFAAAGSGRYTITILPQVPLPLDLFCRGDAPGLQSEPVYVSIPTRPPLGQRRGPETHVPEIVLTPVGASQER